MKTSDLIIIHEDLAHDDNTLIKKCNSAFNEFKKRKSNFDKEIRKYDENNYLSFAVTKLAYSFAKEEYDSLKEETVKRGLIS